MRRWAEGAKPGLSPACLRNVVVLAIIEVMAALVYFEVVRKC